MENPYKEPQKGCALCNVTVDYKNIQVSVAPVNLQACKDQCHIYDSIDLSLSHDGICSDHNLPSSHKCFD